ncbi:MAG: hypothetical protein OXN89_14170 [Bryobacterales bacterium]|nr:hypothetical protein [Bryobacterales bacterium]
MESHIDKSVDRTTGVIEAIHAQNFFEEAVKTSKHLEQLVGRAIAAGTGGLVSDEMSTQRCRHHSDGPPVGYKRTHARCPTGFGKVVDAPLKSVKVQWKAFDDIPSMGIYVYALEPRRPVLEYAFKLVAENEPSSVWPTY